MKSRDKQQLKDHMIFKPQPFFSIIITTYNRAQILKRALNSLIAQSEEDWEAIIVDDESTDDTYAQVLPYISSYAKIKYIWKVHSGEARSKNEGIRSSAGRFISFLDSDDAYDPNHLESRKNLLLQNPSIRFLYGGVRILGNQYVPDRFNAEKEISLHDCAIGGTFFMEKNTLISLNGFRNILLGPDADLFDRARKAGIAMEETKLPTYIYHHENMDSITNKLYLNQQNKQLSDSI
jgi:glycosyltransferase involved in cell wall biosynthesis